MMAFVGVIIAGAASDLYGEEIWDPLTILSHWTGSSRARAGAAFCGLSFALAQLGSNISANCISAANDLNAMFPAVSDSTVLAEVFANKQTVHRPQTRLLRYCLCRCLGLDAMEHLIVCLRPTQLHGRIYHLGTEDASDVLFAKLDC
jgi:hypothetical protein